MKRILVIAGIIVGVILVAVLLLPFFINVDKFRPEIESKLSAALGRTVHIGKISASLFSGGAQASDISISDDPAFNKGPFLQASSLQIGLQMMPLLLHRDVKVNSLTIKSPDILLIKNAAGKWNFSSMGNSAAKTDAKKPSDSSSDISVDKFQIEDGKIRIAQSAGHAAGKEHVYDKVNLLAHNISTTSAIPFTLSAVTPGGGALEIQGNAGPMNAQDSAKTPLDAKISLEHADLAASGLFDPSSGLGGVLDFDGTVKSDGGKIHSEGKAKANNLRLVKGGTPSSQAVNIDYKSDYGLESQNGDLDANVHTGSSNANANGTFSTRGEGLSTHLKVLAKNMAVNDIEGLLPAFGVTLPSGASLQGGALNANLDAQGPLDHMVITGPVDISGTHLAGYNLSSKLGAIAAFTGMKASTDTLIQTFSSALHVAPEGIKADNIVLDVPTIGQLTGNGVIGSNNALDFKMLLKLASGNGGLLGQLSTISAAAQNKGIPFLIQGTTANPTFLPAVGGLANSLKGTLQGAAQGGQSPTQGLGGMLGNILNKKKKPPQ
jgi:AsmA protein